MPDTVQLPASAFFAVFQELIASYDSGAEIGDAEKFKIASAVQFFEALKEKGMNVRYETKLNNDSLAGIIGAGVQT